MAYQDPQALHKQLIQRACDTYNWKTGTRRQGWKQALRTMLDDPQWIGDREDILYHLNDFVARPDAWRLWASDDGDLYLEFLEVEVSHHITEEKQEHYEWFWWILDGTMSVRLQIWRMDRFGIISEFMTGGTIDSFVHAP